MSVIACRIKDDKIYISADSQATRSGDIKDNGCTPLGKSKLVKIGGTIIGATGQLEEAAMLKMFVKGNKLPNPDEESVFCYMSEFYKKRDTFFPAQKERDCTSDNQYIIIYDGSVFFIEQLLVARLKKNSFQAIGIGWLPALGAMEMGAMPRKAVEIACKYSVFCSQPITSFEVPYGKRSQGKG